VRPGDEIPAADADVREPDGGRTSPPLGIGMIAVMVVMARVVTDELA
jgi:hypothetical protein